MVSPEMLRRYPFFAFLNHDQLRKVAMIAEEKNVSAGMTLFKAGDPANALYLLREGNIELHYHVSDERGMEKSQNYLVGMINPGDMLGISGLIRPYEFTTSAVAGETSQLLEFDAIALRKLCDEDVYLAADWHRQIAETTLERLNHTRIQLLAAT
ncbi:MAG: Crp/Fnr family transcriptional regulator [Candidatus Promineifilaceae bacterium]|nr:Crp/Fnr family transcriptional regulator [Candidatus Promineifilaceae bacterium]